MTSRMVYMLFAPPQNRSHRATSAPIQFIRVTGIINRAGPGFCASRDCRSGSRCQPTDLSVTSTSVRVCTSAHLVMYGKGFPTKVLGSLKVRGEMPKDEQRPSPPGPAVTCLRTRDPPAHSQSLPVGIYSLVFGLGRIFTDRRQKGTASTRRLNLAAQNRLERYHLPIKNRGGILVLIYDRARQIDPGKEASGPGIGQDFRSHFHIGTGSGVASHRTCRGGSIRSKFKFAGEQMLHALIICNYHH